MIGPSPLRLHAVVAAVALTGAVLVADGKPEKPVGSFSFTDPSINESSGLGVADDLVLTVNDSGSGPVVHVVDPADGDTVGRTTYSSDEGVPPIPLTNSNTRSPLSGCTRTCGCSVEKLGRLVPVKAFVVTLP